VRGRGRGLLRRWVCAVWGVWVSGVGERRGRGRGRAWGVHEAEHCAWVWLGGWVVVV